MKCCKNADPNPYPLRSEAGFFCGMCICAPPEQRSSHKFFQAVRCYDDEHHLWAYLRFWRSTRQWPQRADAVGDFYVAAAKTTQDAELSRTNHRYAKRFYKRAAQQAPTAANLQRLGEQYLVLAAMAPTPQRAHAYDAKAEAIYRKADETMAQQAPAQHGAGPATSCPSTLS